MKTSAEQIHHGMFNLAPQLGSDERLFIDLDICSSHQCLECSIQCSYYGHNNNNGIHSVVELATYALVCRKCEDPHCVKSCPVNALEQQKEKGSLLIRHNMLCVSCQSCSHACPYGTIYPEHVPLLVHNCDFCMDRRGDQDEPLCIKTCPYGALRVVPGDMELDENTFRVGDHLIVHSTHWQQDKA
jgi:Fe-S-cluster-containing dehydrogenase component